MLSLKCAIVVSLLFVLNQSPCLVTANLITDTCMKTTHVDLCISSIGVDPRSATADVNGLAQIILEETWANAKDILVHKVEYFANQTTDSAVKECLAACDALYRLITDTTIPAAHWHLASKEYKMAASKAMDAALEVEDCEGAFGRKSLESPLTSWNTAVKNFAEISASIISTLR